MTDGRYTLDYTAMHAEHVCDCLVMGERAYARTLEEPRERVVRCRDCKRYNPKEGKMLACKFEYGEFTQWRSAEPDGFCAWGERRADHDRDR